MKLEDIAEGAEVEGVVNNVCVHGVFVDIGAERNARLKLSWRHARRLKRGDHLSKCVVDMVELDTRRIHVSLDDVDATVAVNRLPLEDLEEGITTDGVVTNKGPFGVFVNIGAETDAKLLVPRSIGMRFLRGQVVKDLMVTRIDLQLRRIDLSLEDPAAAAADLVMVGMPVLHPSAMTRSNRQTSRFRDRSRTPVIKLDSPRPSAEAVEPVATVQMPRGINIGDSADGMVTGIVARGVLVDIGLARPGVLAVSEQVKKLFQKGDMVQGMTVEKISALGVVSLSMEDPELEVGSSEPMLPKGKGGKSKPHERVESGKAVGKKALTGEKGKGQGKRSDIGKGEGKRSESGKAAGKASEIGKGKKGKRDKPQPQDKSHRREWPSAVV